MVGKTGRAKGAERWLLRVRKIVKRRGPFPVPRRACQPFLMGKAPQLPALSRDASKIRRATLKRFCPNGANSVNPAHWQRPLPLRGQGSVAKRTTLQTAGSCSRACRRLLPPPPQPKRNAARPPPTHGAGARLDGAEGTGGRHCRLGLSYCTLFCHFFRRKNMQWKSGCIPFSALARKE